MTKSWKRQWMSCGLSSIGLIWWVESTVTRYLAKPKYLAWSLMFQGEALPSAYARIYRAIARQESIERSRRSDHTRDKAGQPSAEMSEEDKALAEIPDTALAEPVMMHATQTGLWDLFGEWTLYQRLILGRASDYHVGDQESNH